MSMANELTCSICLEIYTDPLQLSCLHSYCKQCLKDLLTKTTKEQHTHGAVGVVGRNRINSVNCPDCRKSTPLENGIDGLPRNFMLDNIAVKFTESLQIQVMPKPIILCSLCESNPRPAVKTCPSCSGNNYCEGCLQQCHPMRGAFKEHVLCDPGGDSKSTDQNNPTDFLRNQDIKQIRLDEPVNIEADEHFLQEVYAKKSFVRDELRIVLIGKTGSGKSATGKTITGTNTFQSMASASSVTAQCDHIMLKRFNNNLLVVDTPGLFDTGKSEAEVGEEIKKCVLLTSPGMHALILVTRVGRFTEEEQKTVAYFKRVFGDSLTNYLMIVFTGKDDLEADEKTIEDFIESAPSELKQLIAESGYRYVALDNRGSKEYKDNFVKSLIADIKKMVRANGGKCFTTAMFRKAEAIMKHREEEEKRKIEEEKRKEIEAIQNEIQGKYDKLLHQQDMQMDSMNMELKGLKDKGKKDEHRMKQLESQLMKQMNDVTEKLQEAQKSKEEMLKEAKEEQRRHREDMRELVETLGRKQARASVKSGRMAEHIQYHSLYCREMAVDQRSGELRYQSASRDMPVAQFVGPKPLSEQCNCFSIDITNPGAESCIAIGICHRRYPANRQPGWSANSIGYHADDGGIYHERGSPIRKFGQVPSGSMMKCSFNFTNNKVTFWRDGQRVYTSPQLQIPPGGFYPIVGLHSNGESVCLLEQEPWIPAFKPLQKTKAIVYHSLFCREVKVTQSSGILRYDSTSRGNPVGQFVSECPLSPTCNKFSFDIVHLGQRSCVTIGICVRRYPPDRQPGWDADSIAYHADDGGIYHGKGYSCAAVSKANSGDRMACEFDFSTKTVVFRRNNTIEFRSAVLRIPKDGFHAAVGFHSSGEAVRLLEKEPWRSASA